jgi:uncharacterized protein with PQ loop repeat
MPDRHAILGSAAFTVFVFGLLTWLYVILIQITHPEWIGLGFSHIDFPPFNWRTDEVGMIAFTAAALGFFVWRANGSKRE